MTRTSTGPEVLAAQEALRGIVAAAEQGGQTDLAHEAYAAAAAMLRYQVSRADDTSCALSIASQTLARLADALLARCEPGDQQGVGIAAGEQAWLKTGGIVPRSIGGDREQQRGGEPGLPAQQQQRQ